MRKLIESTLIFDGVIESPDSWNATLLGPDIVRAIDQLKAQPGRT
jgi:hypothetical protein